MPSDDAKAEAAAAKAEAKAAAAAARAEAAAAGKKKLGISNLKKTFKRIEQRKCLVWLTRWIANHQHEIRHARTVRHCDVRRASSLLRWTLRRWRNFLKANVVRNWRYAMYDSRKDEEWSNNREEWNKDKGYMQLEFDNLLAATGVAMRQKTREARQTTVRLGLSLLSVRGTLWDSKRARIVQHLHRWARRSLRETQADTHAQAADISRASWMRRVQQR